MERLLIEFIDTLDATFTETLRSSALEAGHDDLTASQLRTIATIHRLGHATPSDVAAALDITRASVSEQVARLERKGLLSRIPSKQDGRSVLLRLEPPAASLVAARDEAVSSFVDMVRTALGPDGAETFTSLMRQLLEHVERERKDRSGTLGRDRMADVAEAQP